MPIDCPIEVEKISKDTYHKIDYRVMGIIYGVHNDLGRLYDEKIYQQAIINRCREAGLIADQGIPINVIHENFQKKYIIDIIINHSIIYELKTVSAFNPQHRNQLLNYLFLTEINFGKLVNMSPASVKGEFVTTSLTEEERHKFKINDEGWKAIGEESIWLRKLLIELISDWGMFLSLDVYREAVDFFYDGSRPLSQEIDIRDEGNILGKQKVNLLSNRIGVYFSGLRISLKSYKKHLEGLIKYSNLTAIQWVNFNQHNLTLRTITE